MRLTFLRLRVHPLRFFQVSNLRFFEVKTSKNINFRVEVSISEVFGHPSFHQHKFSGPYGIYSLNKTEKTFIPKTN